MTHGDLVQRAVHWLRSSQHCGVILTRPNVVNLELPDAIGWLARGDSILIECKASRNDFLRDQKKPCRQFPPLGMGNRRYYLALPGVLAASDMPQGWGLLVVGPRGLRTVADGGWHAEKNLLEENRLLLAHIRSEQRS